MKAHTRRDKRTFTPNEIGREAEIKAARSLNGVLVPGSGNTKFLKLDFRDKGRFIFSVKASAYLRDTALRAIWKLWQEAVQGARGFSGHGDGAKPGMIFEVNDEMLLLVRVDDYADLATGAINPYITPSRGQERRSQSRASLL